MIFVVTVGLIGASLLNNLFFAPLMKEDARLNAEIKVSKTKLEKYLALLKHKDFFQAQFPQFYSDSLATGNTAQGATAVLMELESLAKGARLAILDIRPGTPGERRKGREIQVEMRAEGKAEDIFRFLYDFEGSLSLLRIKRFSLNVRPHSEVLEARFSIVSTDSAPSSGVIAVNNRRDNELDRVQ